MANGPGDWAAWGAMCPKSLTGGRQGERCSPGGIRAPDGEYWPESRAALIELLAHPPTAPAGIDARFFDMRWGGGWPLRALVADGLVERQVLAGGVGYRLTASGQAAALQWKG